MSTEEKYFLKPGYIFASEQPYLIHTVLGSCVSVCLWDVVRKAGGMNHYIYGRANHGNCNARYGDVSILYLIHYLMREMGCRRPNLRAHIIGGGYNRELDSKIGDGNVAVAEELLAENGIEVATKDVGGETGRKVIFNNVTGEVLVYKGINIRRSDWYPADEE